MRKEASVLFAVSVLTNGGAERVVAALASGMADAGIKTSILLNRRCENEYPVSDKVSIYSLPGYSFSQRRFKRIEVLIGAEKMNTLSAIK